MPNQIVFSIIIPAFNEASGLVPTLEHLHRAQHHFHEQCGFDSEIIVVDADTIVPADLLSRIWQMLESPACLGGVVEPQYQPARQSMRLYLTAWRWYGQHMRMSQGPAQFFRRQSFEQIGGYDESLYVGEDVECIWRLRKLARLARGNVASIRDTTVQASSRRFDQWPTWRVLLRTNPLFIGLFWRWKKAWTGWYEQPPR